MSVIPEVVYNALQESPTPAVFATVSKTGEPNAIWIGIVKGGGNEILLINDGRFSKTRENIEAGSRGAVTFLTADKKSYQLKGSLRRHTDGPVVEQLRTLIGPDRRSEAAVELVVDEVYQGAEKLV